MHRIIVISLLVLFLAGCTPRLGTLVPAVGATHTVRAELPSGAQEGVASWYGPGFAGRLTANGEIFDPQQLTAAHKTLPFGTTVRVTNLDNGRSVIVRINDRGPFKAGRVIDLSRAAAELIGMVGSGTVRVRLDLLDRSAGVLATAVDESLEGFDVVAAGRQKGELLLLSSPAQGPVLVRVVGNKPPGVGGVQILLSPELHESLGDNVTIQASSLVDAGGIAGSP